MLPKPVAFALVAALGPILATSTTAEAQPGRDRYWVG
jgi:tRNA A37 threonylcarbamoyladenosine synthetase subunit TsaC/SUA5/YrdC